MVMVYGLLRGFLVGSHRSQKRDLEGCARVLIAVDVGGVEPSWLELRGLARHAEAPSPHAIKA